MAEGAALKDFCIERLSTFRRISVQSLIGHMSALPTDLKGKVGTSKPELLKFLHRYPSTFSVDNLGYVTLVSGSSDDQRSKTHSRSSSCSSKESHGSDLPRTVVNGSGKVVKMFPAFGFIKSTDPIKTTVYFTPAAFGDKSKVLLKDCAVTMNQSVCFNAQLGPPDFDARYRATKVWIPKSSESHNGDVNSREETVFSRRKLRTKPENGLYDPCSWEGDGTIQNVFPKFGFIMIEHDPKNTAFFCTKNICNYMNIVDLTQILSVGDIVDFRAVRSTKPDSGVRWEATQVFIKKTRKTIPISNDSDDESFVAKPTESSRKFGKLENDTIKDVKFPAKSSSSSSSNENSGASSSTVVYDQSGRIHLRSDNVVIKFGKGNREMATVDPKVVYVYGTLARELAWEVEDGQAVFFNARKTSEAPGWKATLVWIGSKPGNVVQHEQVNKAPVNQISESTPVLEPNLPIPRPRARFDKQMSSKNVVSVTSTDSSQKSESTPVLREKSVKASRFDRENCKITLPNTTSKSSEIECTNWADSPYPEEEEEALRNGVLEEFRGTDNSVEDKMRKHLEPLENAKNSLSYFNRNSEENFKNAIETRDEGIVSSSCLETASKEMNHIAMDKTAGQSMLEKFPMTFVNSSVQAMEGIKKPDDNYDLQTEINKETFSLDSKNYYEVDQKNAEIDDSDDSGRYFSDYEDEDEPTSICENAFTLNDSNTAQSVVNGRPTVVESAIDIIKGPNTPQIPDKQLEIRTNLAAMKGSNVSVRNIPGWSSRIERNSSIPDIHDNASENRHSSNACKSVVDEFSGLRGHITSLYGHYGEVVSEKLRKPITFHSQDFYINGIKFAEKYASLKEEINVNDVVYMNCFEIVDDSEAVWQKVTLIWKGKKPRDCKEMSPQEFIEQLNLKVSNINVVRKKSHSLSPKEPRTLKNTPWGSNDRVLSNSKNCAIELPRYQSVNNLDVLSSNLSDLSTQLDIQVTQCLSESLSLTTQPDDTKVESDPIRSISTAQQKAVLEEPAKEPVLPKNVGLVSELLQSYFDGVDLPQFSKESLTSVASAIVKLMDKQACDYCSFKSKMHNRFVQTEEMFTGMPCGAKMLTNTSCSPLQSPSFISASVQTDSSGDFHINGLVLGGDLMDQQDCCKCSPEIKICNQFVQNEATGTGTVGIQTKSKVVSSSQSSSQPPFLTSTASQTLSTGDIIIVDLHP